METQLTISEVLEKIGLLIERHRNSMKLTQSDLGDRINVSRLTILNIEKGKGSNILTVLKLLKYFDLLQDLNATLDFMMEKAEDDKGISEINLYE